MPNGNSTGATLPVDKATIAKRIRQTRLRAGLSMDEVGQSIGASADVVANIEAGQHDPSLPQLEVMGLIFNVPITDFWSAETPEAPKQYPTLDAINLRQRIIGILLLQARTETGQSVEDVAKRLNIPAEQLSRYEMGEIEIPLSQLIVLADNFSLSLNHFLDNAIAITDETLSQQLTALEQLFQFSQLPEDTRDFLANPANLLYLNIAMRLSELSVDTLRGLAEGLLEVTY